MFEQIIICLFEQIVTNNFFHVSPGLRALQTTDVILMPYSQPSI